MATTPNYSFSVYSSTDTDVKFLDFRVATAGSQSTSNFYVIDTVLKQHSDAIDSINATPSAFVVKGTYSSGSLYTASVANYPGYKNEQLIVLSLNQKNTGAVQININGTTNKDVMKYGSDGVLKAVDAGDFVANSPVLCLYDGTRFVVIGITSASSITVTGEAGDILQIADDGTIESSGKKAAQPNGIATLDENGNVVQVANMANSAAAVYSGTPVTVEYAGAQRIASITAYGENAQGGTTEAPVALTGISSVTLNDDVTELPIPRPLHKVGDVMDVCRTRVKSVYDKRIVLDGSSDEVFIQTNIIDGWIQIATESDAVIPESTSIVGSIKSSYLKAYAIEEVYSKKYSGISVDSNRRIRLSFKTSEYPDVTSVETARTYLSAHPLTVYYQSTAYNGTNGLDVCQTEYQTDYIESYADESITTAWISSTGALSTGAEVAYVLNSPETYATDPIDFDNAAGPLHVISGGELEVRMTELVGTRSDVSNNTVAFTETAQDADIASGEKLSVLFGKIKKRFSAMLTAIADRYTKAEAEARFMPNPNLLDNSDYKIAQAGYNGAHGSTGYLCDRWSKYIVTGSMTDDGMLLTPSGAGAWIIQYKLLTDTGLSEGDTVTLTVRVNGTVYSGSATLQIKSAAVDADSMVDTDDIRAAAFIPAGNTDQIAVYIVIKQTCTLTWTKLEKGSVATPYVPKAFDDEFLECLRYFVGGVGIGSAGIVSGSTFRVLIPTPVPMRTAPSVTVKVADNVVYNGTFKALNTTVSNITRQRNGIHLHIGMAASGVNNYPGIAYGLQCDLSADL